jgi:molybdopterin-guanine dinucleotide biosynthesis adapter protein
MLTNAIAPIIGFAAQSGTGKTTLLIQLMPLLRARGLRVGVVKHAHHDFEIDHPGKDSFELRKSGASRLLIASRARWAVINDHDEPCEALLNDVLANLDQRDLDLVLVEGFKDEIFAKIELHREACGATLLFPTDASIVAVATDVPMLPTPPLPVLNLNAPEDIADFIVRTIVRTEISSSRATGFETTNSRPGPEESP